MRMAAAGSRNAVLTIKHVFLIAAAAPLNIPPQLWGLIAVIRSGKASAIFIYRCGQRPPVTSPPGALFFGFRHIAIASVSEAIQLSAEELDCFVS